MNNNFLQKLSKQCHDCPVFFDDKTIQKEGFCMRFKEVVNSNTDVCQSSPIYPLSQNAINELVENKFTEKQLDLFA